MNVETNLDVLTGDFRPVDVASVDVVLIDVVSFNVVSAKAPNSSAALACCAGAIAISVKQMIDVAKNFKVSFHTLFSGKFKD